MEHIRSYKELRVYQAAIEAAMRIFEITKRFPMEERFSMVDQMRRASRSVCSNIGEAWRKRRYPAHFAASSVIPKAKLRKPAFGWNSRFGVVTFPERKWSSLILHTTESSPS